MYVAWLSIQYQAFTYSTASGTYGFSRVLMIFRFITIRATEPCLNLEYSGFRSRETNSPYNLIGGARRRLSSRDRVQPSATSPIHVSRQDFRGGGGGFRKLPVHSHAHRVEGVAVYLGMRATFPRDQTGAIRMLTGQLLRPG